jgi:hypothetical protein
LAVAAACVRHNPGFSPELTDGRPALDVVGGSDGALADRFFPETAETAETAEAAVEAAPDVPPADRPPATAPSVLVGAYNPRSWYGGGGGVEYLVDRCPDGQVVIGHIGAVSDENTFVGRLRVQCGSLHVTRTEPPYTVEVTPGALLAARGKTAAGAPWTALCPANQVVVRYDGQFDDYVESLSTTCAQLEVSADRRGIRFVGHEQLPAYGSGPSPGFEEDCEILGQVVAGADTRAGGWIDSIRPVCAPLTVVP